MAKKPVTIETIYSFVRVVTVLVVIALIAIVSFFVIDDRADGRERVKRQEAICEAVRNGFHEQAIIFGEFSQAGEDNPELIEYDRRLQEALSDCEKS